MRAGKTRCDCCELLRGAGGCVRREWLWPRRLGVCLPTTHSWTKHLVVVELGNPTECALAERPAHECRTSKGRALGRAVRPIEG